MERTSTTISRTLAGVRVFRGLAGIVLLVAASPLAAQVSLATLDTFDSGAAGWTIGNPQGNINVIDTGGPAGAGDPYLSIVSSGGGGPGSKPVVFNRTQWTGDYAAAGVGVIAMDLINSGNTSLEMRVALRSSGADEAPAYISTNPFDLPNDGLWHHAVFPLTSEALTVQFDNEPPLPPFTLDELLDSVGELRVLHSPTPDVESEPLAASFGIDNVTALVPEPTSCSLLWLGALGLGTAARRRRCRQ
jgi:MYXO-CTERM domain-containing protein